MLTSAVGLGLGLVVGVRHAFEPDHLAAMATLVADARDARRGAWLGAIWGVGHTISLVVVGTLVLAAGTAVPARAAAAFELAVSGLLVVLGVRAIARSWREGRQAHHVHPHGGRPHHHLHLPGGPGHVHVGRRTLARRPLVVGLIHGLAGSGALTALAFAHSPSTASRLSYMTLFGLGSVAGMAAASGLGGAAVRRLLGRPAARRWMTAAVGTVSVALGVVWSLPLWAQL